MDEQQAKDAARSVKTDETVEDILSLDWDEIFYDIGESNQGRSDEIVVKYRLLLEQLEFIVLDGANHDWLRSISIVDTVRWYTEIQATLTQLATENDLNQLCHLCEQLSDLNARPRTKEMCVVDTFLYVLSRLLNVKMTINWEVFGSSEQELVEKITYATESVIKLHENSHDAMNITTLETTLYNNVYQAQALLKNEDDFVIRNDTYQTLIDKVLQWWGMAIKLKLIA